MIAFYYMQAHSQKFLAGEAKIFFAKKKIIPVRIIIIYVILFYNISLVRRPRERKSGERKGELNSSSACAVTFCWMCFDGDIVINWPIWKKTGVAFIGSLIATSKRLPFFA